MTAFLQKLGIQSALQMSGENTIEGRGGNVGQCISLLLML